MKNRWEKHLTQVESMELRLARLARERERYKCNAITEKLKQRGCYRMRKAIRDGK